MPTVITDPARLASAQALFTETIRTALPQRLLCTVSGVGGGFETEAAYSPELNLWYAVQRQGKKCWNGFGIGEPLNGKKVSIAAEINFPARYRGCLPKTGRAGSGCCTAAKSAAARNCFSDILAVKRLRRTMAAGRIRLL